MRPILTALPAFNDNYIWCLSCEGHALVVDPGDASVVESWLQHNQLALDYILVTHHHADHIGGLPTLRNRHTATILGPDEDIDDLDRILKGGEQIDLGCFGQAVVMAVPGHTSAHIAWYLPASGLLFPGDTLFSAGCGRLFEGTAAQMYASLQSLAALPDTTQICCTHEYTLANLRFAMAVEPGNHAVAERLHTVEELRRRNQPSLPVSLAQERRYNPFLRCAIPEVVAATSLEAGHTLTSDEATFTALREWKDHFR